MTSCSQLAGRRAAAPIRYASWADWTHRGAQRVRNVPAPNAGHDNRPSSPRSARPRWPSPWCSPIGGERRSLGRVRRRTESRACPRSPSSRPATAPSSAALAVVVKAEVENFQLAPRHFGGEPLLGEGNIRFSLNRVPDCVDPVETAAADESPIGNGRLRRRLLRLPALRRPQRRARRPDRRRAAATRRRPGPRSSTTTCGPASTGWSSTLADNDGSTTPYHDVTNFQILEKPGHEIADCSAARSPAPRPRPPSNNDRARQRSVRDARVRRESDVIRLTRSAIAVHRTRSGAMPATNTSLCIVRSDADLPPFDGFPAPLPPPALGLAGLRLAGDGDDGR